MKSVTTLKCPWLLQLFQPLNVYLVVVVNDVWIDGDYIDINESDHQQTLSDFCRDRYEYINPDYNNDNGFLIT